MPSRTYRLLKCYFRNPKEVGAAALPQGSYKEACKELLRLFTLIFSRLHIQYGLHRYTPWEYTSRVWQKDQDSPARGDLKSQFASFGYDVRYCCYAFESVHSDFSCSSQHLLTQFHSMGSRLRSVNLLSTGLPGSFRYQLSIRCPLDQKLRLSRVHW